MTDNEVKWLIVGKLLRRNLMAAKGEQWEVLYEGDVTTTIRGDYAPNVDFLRNNNAHPMIRGKTYRLTVNGNSSMFVCDVPGVAAELIGNPYLYYTPGVDNGYDYAVWNEGFFSPGAVYGAMFASRTPGTYSVKLERKVSTL